MTNPFYFAPASLVGFVKCSGGHAMTALWVLLRPKAAAELPEEVLAEITTPFTLAWTGPAGHLLLVGEEEDSGIHLGYLDPAFLAPHAAKLMSDRRYECYFVRHPSLEWVRAAAAELNGFRPQALTKGWAPTVVEPALDKYQPPKPDPQAALPPPMQVLTLTVSESPAQFYPRGPAAFGGWLLYKDMPNAECAEVRGAVTRLQEQLGALRYMVGSEHPYVPERFHKKAGNAATANEGYFDGRTLNAVYLFQKNVQNGEGWTVGPEVVATAGREETEATSLRYLTGARFGGGGRSVTADGVVDEKTAAALAERLRLGVCNPNKIMVCLPARENGTRPWFVWMREEAAAALYCWRELARALGFPETVAANHTFRSAAVNVGSAGFGRSWKSIHKVGLAVDVGLDKNYFGAAADWPVFYQRDVVTEKTNRAGELDSYRIYWRVFAVSNALIPEAAALARCRANLETVRRNQHRLGAVARAAAERLIGEMDDGTFVGRYFRESVRQWQYDAWDADGGKDGPALTAAEARKRQLAEAEAVFAANDEKRKLVPAGHRKTLAAIAEGEAKTRALYGNYGKTASRFVDLTALAEVSGLQRIGSFSNHENPKNTSEWGLGLLTVKTGKIVTLAKSLAALQAAQPGFLVEIGGEEIAVSRIDTAFLTEWAAGLGTWKRCADHAPRVACAVSRDVAGKKRVAQLCEVLRKYPQRRFRREQSGEEQTGEEWAAAVEAKLEEMLAAAPVNKKDASQGSTKKKDAAEWTYRFTPDVALTGDAVYIPARTAVKMPSPGAPIGLEWWHFQVDSVIDRKAFGPLICELGWTKETLLDNPMAHLHYRYGMGYPDNAWTVPAG